MKIKTILLFFILMTIASNAFAKESSYEFLYQDWVSDRISKWENILSPFKGKKDINYLELGVYEGRSLFWIADNILTSPSAKALGIDVFPEKVFESFKKNLKRSPSKNKISYIKGKSFDVLKTLDQKFDLIYVDASHLAKDVLQDAVLSWSVLKPGGILIYDDYEMAKALPKNLTPRLAIDSFVSAYKDELVVLDVGWQVILQKKTEICPFEVNNFVTQVGQYCYFWNWFKEINIKNGLYSIAGEPIDITPKQKINLEAILSARKLSLNERDDEIFLLSAQELKAKLSINSKK